MAISLQEERVPGYQRGSRGMFTLPTGTRTSAGPKDNPPENELVGFCEGLFNLAKQYRDERLGMMERWKTYRSWYLHSGKGWVSQDNPTTIANLIFEKIEKLTADLTDGDPKFLFKPHTRQDVNFTNLLNDAVPYIWQTQSLDTTYYQTVKADTIYGTWYWKIIHDPRYGNTGSVERVKQVPCWYIFPAPYALDPETAPWIIEVMPRTVGEVQADYGVQVDAELGMEKFAPPIEEHLKQYGMEAGSVQTVGDPNGGYAGGETVNAIPSSWLGTNTEGNVVLQKELWIRDGGTTPQYWFESQQKGGARLRRSHSLKYPRGRVISWANGKLLYDMENPYNDGEFPYAKFSDISMPEFWYGLGEVETLINLQLLHNDTHEIIKQTHLFTALGRLVVGEETGLDEDSMGNEPGEIWFVNPGTTDRVKWLPGANVPGEMYNYLNVLERSIDLVSGSFDVTRGVNPAGVTAGKALIALRSAANIRIRARNKDLMRGLSRAARLLASRVQQFWPTDKTIRLTGASDEAAENFNKFRDYHMSPIDRQANFNLSVVPGVNLEELKEAEFNRLMQLFQMGFVKPDTLIETANLTLSDRVIEELPEAFATRMKMAQAMGGGAPPA